MNEDDANSRQEAAEQFKTQFLALNKEVFMLIRNQMTERGLSLPSDRKERLALFESAVRKVAESRQLDADTTEAVMLLFTGMARYPRIIGLLPEEPHIEPTEIADESRAFTHKTDELYGFILHQFEAGWNQESIVQQLAEQGFGENEARPLVEAVYTKAVKVDQDQSAAESTGHFITDVIHLAQDILRMRGLPAPPDRKGRADFLEPIVREVAERLQSGISPRMVRWFAEHLALYPRIWGSMPRGPMVE